MRDGDGRNRVTRSGPSEWSSSLSWAAVSLVAVTLTGVPATVLTLWAAEAVAPTYRQHAVVSRHDRVDPDGNGVAGTYHVDARVANGRTLDITPWDGNAADGIPAALSRPDRERHGTGRAHRPPAGGGTRGAFR